MGIFQSRLISQSDARARCSEDELARYKTAYIRLSKGEGVSAEAFHADVLPGLPRELSGRVYEVFDHDCRGLMPEGDFICALVILAKGSREEHFRTLFRVFDYHCDDKLDEDEFVAFHKVFTGVFEDDTGLRSTTMATKSKLRSLFNEMTARPGDHFLSYDKFVSWASANLSCPVIAWIFNLVSEGPQLKEIDASLRRGESGSGRSIWTSRNSDITATTHFSAREIEKLNKDFYLSSIRWHAMTLDAFVAHFHLSMRLPRQALELVFRDFNKSGTESLSATDFVAGLSRCCHDDPVGFIFELFDSDKDGKLSKLELTAFLELETLIRVAEKTIRRSIFLPRTTSLLEQVENLDISGTDSNVDSIFATFSNQSDGTLTLAEFMAWSSSNSIELLNRLQQYIKLQLGFPPAEPIEERAIILKLIDETAPLSLGCERAVLPKVWFDSWRKYVGLDSNNLVEVEDPKEDRPLSINYSSVLRKDVDLLKPDAEVVIVDTVTMKTLKQWYGATNQVIRTAVPTADGIIVELYPVYFKCSIRNIGRLLSIPISPISPLSYLREIVCKSCELEPVEVRVWDMFDEIHPVLLEDLTLTVEDAQLIPGQHVYFESKLENGRWIGVESDEDESSELPARRVSVTKKGSSGLCGLYNLGNTCFMNSALQCLSLTPHLRRYFLSDLYLHELNYVNPLGMEGKVALSLGALIKNMWSGDEFDAVSPKNLKQTVGKFAPRFNGFQQQDAQELLLFVLDGLHEGTNRVLEKPYVMIEDSNDRPDSVVFKEHWGIFLQRNQSIIVDVFMGMMKSSLRWSCGRVNVKFDPYQILSLPLPPPAERSHVVTVVFNDGSRPPVKYAVPLRSSGNVSDFRHSLSLLCGVPDTRLYIVELFKHSVYKTLPPTRLSSKIQQNDTLYAYETPPTCKVPKADHNVELSPSNESKLETDRVIGWDVGAQYDVLDVMKKWYNATITEVDPESTKVRFHYTGFKPKWDEWIDISSPRIAPLYSKARPRKNRKPQGAGRFDGVDVDPSLIAVYCNSRVFELHEDYLLSPTLPRIRGYPLILFLNPKATTNEDLYTLVWNKVSRYAPIPEAFPPFVLSLVKSGGIVCSQCEWLDNCSGHRIPLDTNLINLSHEQCICIDWQEDYYSSVLERREISVVLEHESVARTADSQDQAITFQDCMAAFASEEALVGDSSPYCSDCKKMHDATKTLECWSTPPVLIVHLKRLTGVRKIQSFVDFPLRGFRPAPFLASYREAPSEAGARSSDSADVYDLIAVINHLGSSTGGHYVTAGLVGGKGWYLFDDSQVTPLKEEDVIANTAYVLFYAKRGVSFDDVLPQDSRNKLDSPLSEEQMSLLRDTKENGGVLGDVCPWNPGYGCRMS